jgi:dihydrofolate reductase
MRKIIAAEYLTLDGIMSDPAWTAPYWSEELAKWQYELLFQSDLLLMGRVTYDGMSKAWPQMTDTGDFGERMNSLPKLVPTSTLKHLEWNATAVQNDLYETIKRYKETSGENILIYGSGTLVRSLMPHDLIDEYRLMIHPVVLGEGMRLFSNGVQGKFKLAEAKTTSTGVAVLTYRRNP